MSDEVGRVSLGVALNSAPFTKSLNSLAGKAKATLGAVLSTAAVGAFSKKCLALGSDLAEVQNVVDVTFRTMSNSVNQWAQSAAGTYGLSETMAKQYVGTFGSMAEAFGFTEKQALDMSETLTGLAGDVASFYNITQDEAYTKLKSVFSGETETLKDLGIVMTQSALDAYALANGFGKTTSAMTEMEKVSLRYAFVQSQLANATGDFARTQDGWANQCRILSLQTQSAMAAVGQGLINLLTPAIKAINAMMGKIVQLANAFSSLTELVFGKSNGGGSATKLSNGLGDASSAAGSIDNATGDTASNLGSAAKSAKKLKRELLGFDQITKLSDADDSSTDATPTSSGGVGSGAGISGAGMSGLSNGADEAEQSTSKLFKSMQKLLGLLEPLRKSWNNLKQSFGAFADVVKSAGKWILDNVLIPLGKWTISKLLPKVLDLLAAAFDVLTSACKALAPTAQWIWEKFLQPIAKWTGGIIIKVLETLTGALKKLSGWIDQHQEAFANIVLAVGSFVAAFVAAQKVIGIITGIVTAVKTVVGAFRTFKTALSMASSIGALLKGMFIANPFAVIAVAIAAAIAAGVLLYKNWDTIKAKASELWNAVKEKFDAIKTAISDAIEGAKTAVKEKFDAIKTAVSDAVESAKTAVTDKFNAIKDGVKEKAESIQKTVSEKFGKVKDTMTSAMETAKKNVKTKLDNMKTAYKQNGGGIKGIVAAGMQGIKDCYSSGYNAINRLTGGRLGDIVSAFKSKLSSAKSVVSDIMTSIKKTFTDKINAAKDAVHSAIDRIKGFFKFKWSLPKLKLPHPYISGKFSLNPPSVPHFGVKWYRKAMDNPMLLDKATIFGASGNNLLGAGEAGPEVVGGARTLAQMIQSATKSGMAQMIQPPPLASVTPSGSASGQQELDRMLDSLQPADRDDRIIDLLLQIIKLLETLDIVRLDMEAMRKWIIKKTNSNTRANGGKSELLV